MKMHKLQAQKQQELVDQQKQQQQSLITPPAPADTKFLLTNDF
jgi:hypothetical protein